MKIFWQYCRMFWHCLYLTIKKGIEEDHRPCFITDKGYFCSCGYLNDGVSFDTEIGRGP